MPAKPSTGTLVAGYRLLRVLGQGAHGTVHLADDTAHGGMVALKLVPLPARAGRAVRDAFLSNAALARGLVHPNIVALLAAGIEGDLGWLAMQPAPGTDLGRYTHSSRLLPEALVLRLAERLARALACAHGQGVVHRDIKPANVLVDWASDSIKLADFGLARAMDAAQTATGVVPGSPAYMAPEQLAGGVPTPRSDLYSLGAMTFQLLAGRLPHEADTMGELLRQVAHEPAPDLRQLNPQLPGAVATLVASLLAKQPVGRPADAAAAAVALRAAAQSLCA